MSKQIAFSPANWESARIEAERHRLRTARRRVYLNALAREQFLDWARKSGLLATAEASDCADPTLAELLDVSDVMVEGRRIGVLAVQDAQLRIDRRLLTAGLQADAYVFVDISPDLRLGTMLGVVQVSTFAELGWLDRSGESLVLDLDALCDMDTFGSVLNSAAEPIDQVWPLDHEEVASRIAEYEGREIPAEDRGPFERHLYNCPDCRKDLLVVRLFKDAHLAATLAQTTEVKRPPPGVLQFDRSRQSPKPHRHAERIQSAASLLSRFAAAPAATSFALGRPDGSKVRLFVADHPGDRPRLEASGHLEGTFVLPDASLSGRTVLVECLLDFDGQSAAEYKAVIEGDELCVTHDFAADTVGQWLATHLDPGRDLWLPPEVLELTLVDYSGTGD